MVIAIQHIDPWTKQLAARLIGPGTPQRGAIALDLGVSLFVSAAVDHRQRGAGGVHRHRAGGVAVRGSHEPLQRSQALSLRHRAFAALSRSGRTGGAAREGRLRAGHRAAGRAVLWQRRAAGADRRPRDRGRDHGCVLLEMRRITEIDSTGARILGDIDAALEDARRQAGAGLVRAAPRRRPVSPTSSRRPIASSRISTARSNGPRTNCSGRRQSRRRRSCRSSGCRWSSDLDGGPDRTFARLAGAGGLAGRAGRLPQRRSRLVALSRHEGPRERPYQARRTATSGW